MSTRVLLCAGLTIMLLAGCGGPSETKSDAALPAAEDVPTHRYQSLQPEQATMALIDPLELTLIDAGLENIQDVVPDVLIDLKYSTTDNFLGTDVYQNLSNCYLQPDVAQKVAAAQASLKAQRPDLTLLIFDGVRPRSIQQKMWEQLDSIPVKERIKYVSNPANGSLHNFGAAVDLTLADTSGVVLDMGTEFDHFGELAYPRLEWQLLEEGKLSREQVDNRSLLRAVMYKAGFTGLETEWWHFNSCSRKTAREQYTIVE